MKDIMPVRSFRLFLLGALVAWCSSCGSGGSSGGGGDAPQAEPTSPKAMAFKHFYLLSYGDTELQGEAVTATVVLNETTGRYEFSDPSNPRAATLLLTFEPGYDALNQFGQEIYISPRIDGIAISAIKPEKKLDKGPIDLSYLFTPGKSDAEGRVYQYNSREIGGSTDESTALITILAYPEATQPPYEYQSFGNWVTGYGVPSRAVGAGSFGSRTAQDGIPVDANANYSGELLGLAVLKDGQLYSTVASVYISTDFQTISIESRDTEAVRIYNGVGETKRWGGNVTVSKQEMDFAGSGPVSGTSFTADVAGDATSGKAGGVFYGPNANEIGGTYQLTGPGGVSHIGGFGARQ